MKVWPCTSSTKQCRVEILGTRRATEVGKGREGRRDESWSNIIASRTIPHMHSVWICWWCVNHLVSQQHIVLFDNSRVQLHSYVVMATVVGRSSYILLPSNSSCTSVCGMLCAIIPLCAYTCRGIHLCVHHTNQSNASSGAFEETYIVHHMP